MQQLTIAGNVGKDAVLRRTQGGDAVLGFSLAVNNGRDKDGNDRPATWYDCSIWGKRAESLERHITKGTKMVLQGRPSARAHEGKAYLQISVDELEFMGGGSQSDSQGGSYGQQSGTSQQGSYGGGSSSGYGSGGMPDDDLDSIPF